MAKLRSVSTSFWSDPYIEELSPSEKLLYIYFITNEKTNMLGIYEVSIKKISFETGIPKETVSKALESFERVGKIKYIGQYIVLTNFMKHQNYNPNMKKAALACYAELPKEVKDSSLVLDESNPLKAFESLLNHYGMVRKYEYKEEVEYKEESNLFETVLNFESFWELYPNKVGKVKCEAKYKNISEPDRIKIKETIQAFIKYKPFESYNHPNPETYLNQKRWEDVIPEKPKERILTQEEINAQKERDFYESLHGKQR